MRAILARFSTQNKMALGLGLGSTVDRAVCIVTLEGVPSVLRDLGALAGGWDKVSNAQTRANAVSNKFLLAGGTIAGAMFMIGRASLDASGEIEAVRIGLETMLGSATAARTMLNQWKNFALLSPYDFQQIAKSGQLLLAMGIRGSELMKVLHGVGEASAAAGGGTDRFARALYAIGEIKSIGTLQARQLRMLATAGIPAREILKDKLKLTDKDFENIGNLHIPAQKAIDALLEGFEERYPHAMEKLNKTLKGQLSQLRDAAFQTAAAFGDIFNKDATHVISGMVKLVTETKKFIEMHPRLVQWGVTFAGIAGVVLVAVGGFLKLRNMARDLFGVTPKSQKEGGKSISAQNVFIAAMRVYVNGPVVGGGRGTLPLPGQGGNGTQPLPGGGTGPLPGGATLASGVLKSVGAVLAGILVGAAGYETLRRTDARGNARTLLDLDEPGNAYKPRGVFDPRDTFGPLTNLIPGKDSPGLIDAGRNVIGRAGSALKYALSGRQQGWDSERGQFTYDSKMQMAAASEAYKSDLDKVREHADEWATKNKRSQTERDIEYYKQLADYEKHWSREYARNKSLSGFQEHEKRRRSALQNLQQARAEVAQEKQSELTAWGRGVQARLQAEEEAKNGKYNLSPAARKLAEQFGMVPEADLRDNRKVKVKTVRDNEDAIHFSGTIHAGGGDRLARNLRFGLSTPAPVL
jgi:hypothetical protein